MILEEGLVFGVLMKRIDAERVLFENGAYQIKTRVLIPATALVKVAVGKHQDRKDQQDAGELLSISRLLGDGDMLLSFWVVVQSSEL